MVMKKFRKEELNAADPARLRLTRIRGQLLPLHKVLLDGERLVYEREHGAINSPYEMLGLVTQHPFFAWLRQLSAFIVQIDESLDADDPPASAEEIESLTGQTRALLAAENADQDFGRKYRDALRRTPAARAIHDEIDRLLDAEI